MNPFEEIEAQRMLEAAKIEAIADLTKVMFDRLIANGWPKSVARRDAVTLVAAICT